MAARQAQIGVELDTVVQGDSSAAVQGRCSAHRQCARTQRPAITYRQRAGIERGAAPIAIAACQRGRARAVLHHAARAADRIAHGECVAALERQCRAPRDGDVAAAMQGARGTAIAQLQGAGIDGPVAGHALRAGQRPGAATGLGVLGKPLILGNAAVGKAVAADARCHQLAQVETAVGVAAQRQRVATACAIAEHAAGEAIAVMQLQGIAAARKVHRQRQRTHRARDAPVAAAEAATDAGPRHHRGPAQRAHTGAAQACAQYTRTAAARTAADRTGVVLQRKALARHRCAAAAAAAVDAAGTAIAAAKRAAVIDQGIALAHHRAATTACKGGEASRATADAAAGLQRQLAAALRPHRRAAAAAAAVSASAAATATAADGSCNAGLRPCLQSQSHATTTTTTTLALGAETAPGAPAGLAVVLGQAALAAGRARVTGAAAMATTTAAADASAALPAQKRSSLTGA